MQTNVTDPTPLSHLDSIYKYICHSKMFKENILARQLRQRVYTTDILVLDQVFKKLTR